MFGGSDTSFMGAIRRLQGISHCLPTDPSPKSTQLLVS